jgi:hypothetical protein
MALLSVASQGRPKSSGYQISVQFVVTALSLLPIFPLHHMEASVNNTARLREMNLYR